VIASASRTLPQAVADVTIVCRPRRSTLYKFHQPRRLGLDIA